ncbi:RNA polymerase sigma factor [Frankia sp. CiP3]|uniref:RNA polymerase sigma factor n=1 Tax=Frankia sp. CiP3 TaxID=2880971 RepID=UPI001EF5D983|nr:sigma-70 family RNA polymerase sigma factor [Frankia sp. CiP3]
MTEHSPSAPTRRGGERYDPTLVAAFSAFYRAETLALVAFLVWQGVPAADVADVAQEAMARLLDRWEQVEHPRAWVRTVAGRVWGRKVASVDEQPVGVPPEPSPLLSRPGEVDAIVGRFYVLDLLATLPSRQRQVMAWTFDGFTPTEIAAELHITPEAVRTALAKGRRALAAQLADEEGDRLR